MARPVRGKRRRTNDPSGLRNRLLDVAFEAFCTRGYGSTPMHDLIRLAGVTGGALAHHFPSKKQLALAVIRDRVADAVERTWIEPVVAAETALDGVRRVFQTIAVELDRRGAVAGCPVNNLVLELAGQDEDFREALDAIFETWRKAIAEKIEHDRVDGRFVGLDADSIATLVVAVYSGAMAMAKSRQSAEPLRQSVKQLSELLREHDRKSQSRKR
jgi:AcrR family transcriptional regulator